MRLGRGARGLAGSVVAALALGPLLALVPGVVVDRGPDGAIRATAFHLALAALDPLVVDVVVESVLVSAAVAAGSALVGIVLARLASRRSWGRRILYASGAAPLAVPALFLALGLRGILDRLGLSGPEALAGWAGRIAWIWAEMAWAAPLIALQVGRALRKIDPAREDAARLAGGGGWRTWTTVLRPVLRPTVARASAWTFALVLVEPGAPLVLGIRRSLAYQLVQAATLPSSENRAAALALIAVALAAAVWAGLLWWGRRDKPDADPGPPAEAHPRPTTRGRAAIAWVVLGLWAAFAGSPLLGLIATVTGDEGALPASSRGSEVEPMSSDVPGGDRDVLLHSAVLGASVATIGLGLAWWLSRPADAGARTLIARAALAAGGVPPLALAVGASMIPGLLKASARALADEGTPAPIAGVLTRVGDAVDPVQSPLVLLVWAVLVVHLSGLVEAVEAIRGRSRAVLAEAARTLGATRRTAWRTVTWPLLGPSLARAWLQAAVLAALDVAPALVLTPTSDSRTLGPAVLDLAAMPDGLRPAASVALAASLVALAVRALVAWKGPTVLAVAPPR